MCRDIGDSYSVMLECGHYYHEECISKWVEKADNRCPLCFSDVRVIGQYYRKTIEEISDCSLSECITPWVWKVLVRYENSNKPVDGEYTNIEYDYLLTEVTKLIKEERPWFIHKRTLTIDHVLTACITNYNCQLHINSMTYKLRETI